MSEVQGDAAQSAGPDEAVPAVPIGTIKEAVFAVIADLRRRAQRCLDLAHGLEEAYGVKLRSIIDVPVIPFKKTRKKVDGRLPQLRRFLLEQGPTIRADILRRSGIPAGTVGVYLCAGSPYFVRYEDGRWGLKEVLNGQGNGQGS